MHSNLYNKIPGIKEISFRLIAAIFILLWIVPAAHSQTAVDEDVKNLLNAMEDKILKLHTYRFTIISENWKGKLHEKKLLRFQFQKPNLMRVDVLKGRKKGSAVVLNEKGKVRGKNSWGIKITMRPKDKRLENIRGYTFMNSSLIDKMSRLKMHILERSCSASVRDEDYMDNPAYHLHIDHNDEDDPVTSEDLWIQKETYLLLKSLKFEGERKVTDTTWQDFEVNIPLDENVFNM